MKKHLFIFRLAFFIGLPLNSIAMDASKTEMVVTYQVPKTEIIRQKWFSKSFYFPKEFDHENTIPVFLKLQTVVGSILGPIKYRWHEAQIHVPVRLQSGKDGYYIPYVRTDSIIMKSFFTFLFENQIVSGDHFVGLEHSTDPFEVRFEDRSKTGEMKVYAAIENENQPEAPISEDRLFVERWINQDIIALDDRNNIFCIPVRYDIDQAVQIPATKAFISVSNEFSKILGWRNRSKIVLQTPYSPRFNESHIPDVFVWKASAHMGVATPCH